MIKMIKMIKQFLSLFTKPVDESLWGWLLGIGEKPTDYILGSGDVSFKQKLSQKKDLRRELIYEYDQGAQWETRNWCTIYSAITELSFLMDRKFSLCEIQRVGHKMIADWKLDPDKWAFLSDAIDYVRRDWNENNPENLIESFQIDYTDLWLIQVLDNHIPRPTQFWYRTSTELSKDKADGVVDGKNFPKVGGHAVTRWKWETVDNYSRPWRTNRYRFAHFQDLIKNWVIFKNGYIFLKK